MVDELRKKIEWFEKRHAAQALLVESLESDRKINRSSESLKQIKDAKKEKLRLKDNINFLKLLERRILER